MGLPSGVDGALVQREAPILVLQRTVTVLESHLHCRTHQMNKQRRVNHTALDMEPVQAEQGQVEIA